MDKTPKPVRKCHGCPLNFGGHCGVFDNPHGQWHDSRCSGYKNDALYQQYLDGQARHPPDEAKASRRDHARLAHTEPHHDGTLAHRSPYVDRRRDSG